MLNFSLKFRFKAFGIHLGISILIALVSLYIVFMVWHPAPLAKVVGVTHIFIMMLGIDVILGPLLTFIVARQGKKSLKFDLAVIIVLQFVAFTYGIYNIAISRPVYIAFDTSRFEVVQANNIPVESLEQAPAPYNSLGWGQPKFVGIKPIENIEQKNDRLFVELETGVAPSMQPNLYEPLDNQWSIMSKQAKPLNQLKQRNNKNEIEDIIANHSEADSWLPLKGYESDAVVLLNKDKQRIIGIVDLRP